MTICSGFFDCCLPIDLGEKANRSEAPNASQAMKSQHDMYWDDKCEASPTAPGCKVYENWLFSRAISSFLEQKWASTWPETPCKTWSERPLSGAFFMAAHQLRVRPTRMQCQPWRAEAEWCNETTPRSASATDTRKSETPAPYTGGIGMLQARCPWEQGQALLMQGAFELGLVAILFVGLQVWWLSKVFLNRPRQPRPMGKPMRANSLQNERNALEKLFGKSWSRRRHQPNKPNGKGAG